MSLEAQLADCRRYAAMQGWVLGSEYQDVLKGTRDDRPAYQALLSDVRRLRANGRAAAVVVAALDRFGRAILERVRSREELKLLGVPTHSVRDGGEVSDIVANVLAAVAQEEVRRLGERVAAVRNHLAGNGWKLPGRAPWGYRWRPCTPDERAQGAPASILELDPATAPYAREMFERVAAGQSLRQVALWIAGLPSELRSGRNLRYARVRAALSTPVYVGRLEVHPEPDILARPRGRWPALVPDKTYRRAQDQITSHAQRPKQASGRYLATGFLRCPKCGGRLAGDWGHARQTRRYRCNAAINGSAAPRPTCTFTVIGPPIDGLVLDEASHLVQVVATHDPDLHAAIRQAWAGLQADRQAGGTGCRIRQLEQAGERARERLKRAAVMFVDGSLDQTGYELARQQAETDLEAAEAEAAGLRGREQKPSLPPLDEVLKQAGGWREILEGSNLGAQRDVLAQLVERVVPERLRVGRYRVVIDWTPTGRLLQRLAASLARTAAA
jgi:DNA invertase Pin-like site-specific DNA recombinase